MSKRVRLNQSSTRAYDPQARERTLRSRLRIREEDGERRPLRTRVTDRLAKDVAEADAVLRRFNGKGNADNHGGLVDREPVVGGLVDGGFNRQPWNSRAGGGRPPGTPNRLPRALMEGLIQAARNIGRDGNGKDELVGYLEHLAVVHPATFGALLGRILPKQVDVRVGSMAGELLEAIRQPRVNGYEQPMKTIEHMEHVPRR